MSQNERGTTGGTSVQLTPDRVLAAFDGHAPETTRSLAAELNAANERVDETCRALCDRDALARRELDCEHGTVTAWYRPADAEADLEERAERTLAELSVPGTSEMMRDWRRDAVRAAFEFVVEDGPVVESEFIEHVFPTQNAGYDDAEQWWEMVAPRLAEVPGVSPPTDGEVWTSDVSR
ncbi:hypothetical protein [Haloarchaeobius sp. FL176]|uniref:hypothetical protein n=1 Tax=Haloarchaeobius sp. FL176 TaxID=2967129 RepID=UPI002147E68C|nr:hypothetical protein [Haloarchaeobius sp. FL176]